MDMAAWLWTRERRDSPAVLAHALSLAPTRDALLRHAAITEQWDQLAVASTEAAVAPPDTWRWSRSGPDAVTAICHWISADRTLRGIPPADRAAPLAAAALAAWVSTRRTRHSPRGIRPAEHPRLRNLRTRPQPGGGMASID